MKRRGDELDLRRVRQGEQDADVTAKNRRQRGDGDDVPDLAQQYDSRAVPGACFG
jgi:hypothetical protein